VADAAQPVSSWAPLRFTVFRAFWIALLVSNIGNWMQTVGAQWFLVHAANAAILVALVQVADTLPDALFGLVGGVLADLFDRRRLLLVVQLGLGVVAVALAVLTFLGQMTAPLLLAFTFALGSASVFANPAFQSLIPDIVPREELRAAAALGSISINLSRVVGPALAGLVIARLGIAAVFGLNALTYLLFVLVVAIWKPPVRPKPALPEHFFSAIRAGGRYVRNAPVVRRILLRMALYLVPASVLWSLLPVLAAQRLHLGAIGYGLLQGSLGIGAVAGALALPQIRNRLSDNGLMAVASAAYAIALVLVAAVPIPAVALIVLLPAGAAWVLVLSNVNAAVQLFLPAWVRARGVSVYLMLLFGTQALGSVLWGAVAEWMGVVAAFLIAAAALIIGLATIRLWPFIDVALLDRSVAPFWPEPQLVFDPEPSSGPVLVETEYTIATEREEAFLDAMVQVRLSRLRTGATRWTLYRDGEKAHTFVETFVVASWEEHLRQHHDRLTGADRDFDLKARDLSDPPSETRHLIAAEG
jgi:MFS family permease